MAATVSSMPGAVGAGSSETTFVWQVSTWIEGFIQSMWQ
jgi:hypothetical protein